MNTDEGRAFVGHVEMAIAAERYRHRVQGIARQLGKCKESEPSAAMKAVIFATGRRSERHLQRLSDTYGIPVCYD